MSKRLLGLLVAVLLLSACEQTVATLTPAPTATNNPPTAVSVATSVPPTPTPANRLGDTWIRPTDGAVMVYVPAGEFVMGTTYEQGKYAQELCKKYGGESAAVTCGRAESIANEKPAHSVILDGFWIDRTEVTNGQYQRCVAAGACTPPVETGSYTRESYYGDPTYDDYPVVWVTQQQAADYCAWAGGRLPTEAQWEYAARGPESLIFPWGNEFDGTRLNYCDAGCATGVKDPTVNDGYPDTAPVGSFPTGVSWCGALDLAGNVREWVADWFGYYTAERQVNPTGPSTGTSRIPRGGCWLDRRDDTRSANRGENTPDYTRHKVGFRCALCETATQSSATSISPTASAVPLEGVIVFYSERDGDAEIYAISANGDGLQQLTNNSATDQAPALSPDGSRIAFVSDRDGNREIYVMAVPDGTDADGSDPQRLTNDPAYESHPAWSPDGMQIAFISERDGNREIYVMNADGSDPRRLTNDPAEDMRPNWSPDGKQIAFNSNRDGNWEIYVMTVPDGTDADGNNLRRLTNSPAWEIFPAWSPDGMQIAYRYSAAEAWDGDVWVMNADGSDQRRLTRHPGNDENPCWSPDGAWIVFQSDRYADPGTAGTSTYNFELLIMDADGGNVRRLTNHPAGDYWPAWGPAPGTPSAGS